MLKLVLCKAVVGVQDVSFRWYVNGTEVFFENSTSSTLIYTPQTTGVYLINATVNGFSDGKVIIVTVLPHSTQSPTVSTTPTPTVPEFSWLTIYLAFPRKLVLFA